MVSDKLLEFSARSFSFDGSTLRFISDSTNQVYSFTKNGRGYIARFSERPAEALRQINAEMDWLYYLANNGVNVSLPLKTTDGGFAAETDDDGRHYIICAFEMASGRFWDKNNPDYWNERIFRGWGKAIGDIHRLTKTYSPSNPLDVRPQFTGREGWLSGSIAACPSVSKIADGIIDEILSLPKDRDNYGLIHCDIHPWNFYIDGDKINIFDFDDALYGRFAFDIAVAIYHGLWWGRKNDAGQNFAGSIAENIIDGYLSANTVDDSVIAQIPLFMRYRQICKFSWMFDPNNIDNHQLERIGNIERGVLFSDCNVKYANGKLLIT